MVKLITALSATLTYAEHDDPPKKKKRAGDCERALFSPCGHLSSVMVQNSHTCEGDMMKENNIRTSEANRKTS